MANPGLSSTFLHTMIHGCQFSQERSQLIVSWLVRGSHVIFSLPSRSTYAKYPSDFAYTREYGDSGCQSKMTSMPILLWWAPSSFCMRRYISFPKYANLHLVAIRVLYSLIYFMDFLDFTHSSYQNRMLYSRTHDHTSLFLAFSHRMEVPWCLYHERNVEIRLWKNPKEIFTPSDQNNIMSHT